MDFNEDPFPPSLPHFEGPRILETHMTEAMEETGFQFDSLLYDSPEFFSDSYQSPNKSHSGHTVVNPTDLGLSNTQAPESLPDSSSSDSSNNQCERKHSSDSSSPGAVLEDGDARLADGTPGPSGILIGASPMEAHSNDKPLSSADFDSSNRAMECHFDFNSAASSPNQLTTPKPTSSSSTARARKIPVRSKHKSGSKNGPKTGRPKATPDSSPFSSMLTQYEGWPAPNQQLLLDLSGSYVNGAPKNVDRASGIETTFILPTPTSNSILQSTIHLYPMQAKSRVETQIPVKMTLHPMPPGIKKLHLQSYSVAKPKHLFIPTPAKSPEMLELHAMLVCASAMQDPEKLRRALARATNPRPLAPTEGLRSSSDDSASSVDDDKKASKGGPVNICKGCMVRERKRANRKKKKDPELERLWQKDEAERSISFDNPEVIDWQKPGPPHSDYKDFIGPEQRFPDGALQVNLPMRVACYCRHQEEKLGYQVIFTLRDHQDNVFVQFMTRSIMITDDHKSHAPASATKSQAGSFPQDVVVPVSGVFPRTPTANHGPASFRHSYSTTDLQGMQQSMDAQPISPYAIPHNGSQNISANMILKPLSRPASPSVPLGQQHKRRKASTSGRIRNDLTMTKLQTPTPESTPKQGTASAVQSTGLGSAEIPGFIPPYAPYGQPLQPMPTPFGTSPSTPSAAGGAFFSAAQRSQSMENLERFRGVYPTPESVRASRAQSPVSVPPNSGLAPGHAQTLANSLYSVPGAVQHQRSPVIHKLTPAEGPKSGGIEVTCLGSDFHRGLEIMFGEAQATTTTFWGESALVCLVPPALQAGTVLVTFKHDNVQNTAPPPNKLAIFKYIDDDEQMLMKHALTLVNRKWNGPATDAGDSARNIINFLGTNGSFSGGSNHGGSQARYSSGSNAAKSSMNDLETAVLSCLNLVDLDDSPFHANIDAQESNGQSMLHLSASLGHYRLTAGLLARGANPDIRDNNGISPMHLASLRGHPQIIRKLRSAGADPTLRSLNGFTPADMATSRYTRDASNAFDQHTRSRSAGASPARQLSRANSARSFDASFGLHTRRSSNVLKAGFDHGIPSDETFRGACRGQPMTPTQLYSRSRRNSMVVDQEHLADESQDVLTSHASLFAANPALSALRDQLSAQIQQLQQSVHRTLPALQIPAFPPIPNLPDYQAYPVVRRISSLVPQRNARPSSPRPAKEADYHWWELLTGAASSPPAYEEIYPEKAQRTVSDKKASILRAAGEAFMDQKCEANLGQSESSPIMENVDLEISNMTKRQREQLRTAHAMKVKKLRSDRNLFFIWIPLLVLVLIMMLKDRAPKAFHSGYQIFQYARERIQDHMIQMA